MKPPVFIEELLIWLRSRFSLTQEEKNWALLILVIFWVGLLGRYLYLKNQTADVLTPQQIEALRISEPFEPSPLTTAQ
jgi:hypothetical protein